MSKIVPGDQPFTATRCWIGSASCGCKWLITWNNFRHKVFPYDRICQILSECIIRYPTFVSIYSNSLRGALGFSVLRFGSLLRSVFRFLHSKSPVFRFWYPLRFSVFPFLTFGFRFLWTEQKSGYSVLASNWRIVRSFLISLQKFHLHMSRRQWKKQLLLLNIAKISFGIMRKFALQAVYQGN